MRSVTEIQQRLIDLGYPCGAAGADGHFGEDSLDAYNRFRAGKGFGPVVKADVVEATSLLFPEDTPTYQPKGPSAMDSIFTKIFGGLLGSEAVQSYLRSALMAFGAGFVTDGMLTSTQLNAVVGGVMVLVSVLLSKISSYNKATYKAVAQAVDAHPDITVVPAADTGTGKPKVFVDTK
jgi:hypothetical protein